jgi:dipeptidyl aminopeptidase/acylaminoacyl peptidase
VKKGCPEAMNRQGIQINDLYQLKALSDPRLSPDGKGVIYVQTLMDEDKDDYVSALLCQNIKTGNVRQWTFRDEKVSSPRWSSDGERIAFISNRSGMNQLYLISRTGGEAEQVTNTRNGVSNPVWSPCGGKIVCSIRMKKGETFEDREENKAVRRLINEVQIRRERVSR